MAICPTCSSILIKPSEDDPAMCQRCIMEDLMGSEDLYNASSDSDDYEIERELGRGGDGSVYLGIDRKVGRKVALKLIRTMRRDDDALEQRFRAEVEAIASLDHPNIIPIYANGDLDGRLFYSMKYVCGGSLATRIDEFATPEAAAELMGKLARGIHHAHERGILHRDLKPSNILLDETGEPFISDFGLAKLSSQDLNLTVTGSIMGTPAYMSPEQARGDNNQVTTTSDVFSLGSIFYQLLTGRQAFEGESSHVVLRGVIESEVVFPNQKLDQDLRTVCLKCLRKDPDKRYHSALDLAEDLERWRNGEPVEARRISSFEKSLRWMRRYPVLVGMLVVAVTSLVVGSVVSFVQWQKAEKSRESADLQRVAAEKARFRADVARVIAEENEYYLTVANALSSRERFDFGEARRLLDSVDPERRDFEWRLVNGLSSGDQEWSVELEGAKPLHLIRDEARDRILLLTADRQFYEVDPQSRELTLAGELPDTPGGSSVGIRHPGILHFAFAPDGKHYSVIDGKRIMIVDQDHQVVHDANVPADSSATWMDGNRLLTTGGSFYSVSDGKGGYRVSAWYYDLEKEKWVDLSKNGWLGPLATSADGSRVAIGRTGQTMAIYKTGSDFEGEPEFRFPRASTGRLNQVRFSPNGRYLAIGWKGKRTTVRVYDLETMKKYMGQFWPTEVDFCFSSNSQTIFVMGRESWFSSWQFLEPRATNRVFDDGHPSSQSYEVQGPFGPPSSLLTRNTGDHKTTFFFGHHAPIVASLALPENGEVFTVASDGRLKKWSLESVREVKHRRDSISSSHEYYHPIASLNGKYCLYRNSKYGKRAERWHVPSGRTLLLPEQYVGLAVFNDGRVLVRDSGSLEIVALEDDGKGGFIELWREEPEGSYEGSGTSFIQSAMTDDERFVSVFLWGRFLTVDMVEHRCQIVKDQVMVRGSSPGQSTTISPDGRFLAITGLRGATARIYQVANPRGEQRRVVPESSYTTKDSACVYSCDGSRLYVGNNDGWVRVFDAKSLEEISSESWRAHSSEVTAIAVSRSGEIVATAGGDKIILWSDEVRPEESRRRRLSLDIGTVPRNWIQFGGEDRYLIHCGPSRPLEVWEASVVGDEEKSKK